MEKSHPSQFQKARQQTDESLFLERGKTDDSLGSYNHSAEGKTDKVVKEERQGADEARLQRRRRADVKRDGVQLSAERRIEDKEIEKERSSMDLALVHERSEKERLMTKFLSLERGETDKNLLGERNQTDLELGRSAGVLKVEQAAHSQTRSALTTREEFVAIVSHDLRNPIGTILAASQLLLDDESFNGIGEEAKKWIEMIKRNAMASLRLITDILDMERIVDGKIQLHLTVNPMNELIKESLESQEHVAKAKGITLKFEAMDSSNFVPCDKDRISQVLSNLIGNALKFTPEGGAVTVTELETENEIEVSITDTGPGIPRDQQNQIFERFAQLTNKDRSGIGLGLYISKTLVESHRGKIWVTSSPGEGSKFSFTVPKSP